MTASGSVGFGQDVARARSLADDLRARSDEELVALLAVRPDLIVPVPVDINQLATRATTRTSIARALDRLDRFHLNMLEAACVLPEPLDPLGVARMLGAEQAQAKAALELARLAALLWSGPDGLHVTRTVRDVIGPAPAGLGPPAEQALASVSPARLAGLVRDLGLAPSGDAARDASSVAGVLSDPVRLAGLLDDVGEAAHDLLAVLADGPATGRLAGARRDLDSATARTPAETLLARGLLVPVDTETVVLPREVALHLRGGLLYPGEANGPPVPGAPARDVSEVDRNAGAVAMELVRQVEAVGTWLSSDKVSVLRSGGLGIRDMRRAVLALDVDEARAALLLELSWVAGLLASDVTEDRWLPTPGFDQWSAEDVARRWARLATAWRDTSRVPSLVGSRDDRDRPVATLGPELDRAAAPEIRAEVLTALAELPPGGPASLEELLGVVRWRRPRRGGRLRDDLVVWTVNEAAGLGVTAFGALSSFGRALRTGSIESIATALRPALPQPVDHVLVQADLTAVAPGPLRSDLAREMALLADVVSTGGATVYRFTPASVRRGMDSGRSAVQVHEFLARVSRTTVPQPLTYLVDDLARRHGALRVGTASSFLRSDDTATLEAILVDRRAADLQLRRLAPTVLASQLPPGVLLDRLRAMGQAPVAETAEGELMLTGRDAAPRSSSRQRPQPLGGERTAPTDVLLRAAVRALRAGERTSAARPARVDSPRLGRSGPAETLSVLRNAVEAATTVWIGYLDNHGSTSERLVDPVRMDGGFLTAFDHRAEEVRTFAVHRISDVVPVAGLD